MPSILHLTETESFSLVSDVGNWVYGDRFWGRENEIEAVSRLLRDGANIAMSAPRRIGKTSLMREVARRLEGEFAAVHVDLQGALSLEDVVVELTLASRSHRELHRRALDVFRNALGKVEHLQTQDLSIQIRSAAAQDWQSKADRLLDEFVAHDPPVVVYIDELAILVNRLLKGHDYTITPARVAVVDQLMSWLRRATIRHARKIRFVIASSIGLAPVLRQAKLSATLNTFTPFTVHPWDRPTAHGALGALANHVAMTWEDGAREAVIERLGACIPHHVQVFWRSVHEDARARHASRVTVDDVERVYRLDMLGSHEHIELGHYEERLTLMLGEHLMRLAIDLLSEAAISDGLTFASAREFSHDFEPQQLREVIDVLTHDGYLQLERDTYVFQSKFLRDWWSRRHGVTHQSPTRPPTRRGTHD
jgi:hypothetical protein